MKSFRKRVILWTSLIAGLVMLAFALASLVAYQRLRLEQVDTAIELLLGRPAPPPGHQVHWNRVEEEIVERLEGRFGAETVLAVYGELHSETDGAGSEADEPVTFVVGDMGRVFNSREQWPEVRGDMPDSEFERGRGRPGRPPGFGRGFGGPMRSAESIETRTIESESTGEDWRIGIARYAGFNVLVAVRLDGNRGDLAGMRNALLLVFPAAMFVLGASIWIFVTKAIRPVESLGLAMEGVSAESLRKRVQVDGVYEEFDTLIRHFNAMLDRLDASFRQATRFSADAAHELKTPLTIIQGQIEAALQRANAGSSEQVTLAGLLDEVFRLKAITRKLLLLAQADAGQLEVNREQVSLGKLVEETIGSLQESGERGRFRLEREGERSVLCDLSLTRQILSNLLVNALKYGWPDDSEIVVRVGVAEGWAYLVVENGCRPLDASQRAGIFDRFARIDAARNRKTDGVGLGLSLGREFARVQGGRLELMNTDSDERIAFRLRLPCE